jgi:hypothetical protein
MHKSIGYVIAIIGIIALGLSTIGSQAFQDQIGLDNKIADNTVMIGGIILIAVGILFIVKGSSARKGVEVPIYKGKEVVGYRRLDK